MGIINEALDNSQKRDVFSTNLGLTGTGVTGIIVNVPYACSVDAIQAAAFGLSGAPQLAINVTRFVVGAGVTVFPLAVGTSNTLQTYGTSGPSALGMLIPQIGSTLSTLFQNDVLSFQTSVANTAVTSLSINVILRPINDYLKWFNLI